MKGEPIYNRKSRIRLALSNSHPSGTGSFSYDGSFKIIVQNLAFGKQVSIWTPIGPAWIATFTNYSHSLPENREIWIAQANNSEGEFVAKYMVNGSTYWDNNGGVNYKFPQGTAPATTEVQFAVYYCVLGTEYLDNNFSRDYKVTSINIQQCGGVS